MSRARLTGVGASLPSVFGLGRRVWGRHESELTVEVVDPVGRGVLRPWEGADPLSLSVRPARPRDHWRLADVRAHDREWLSPWEATLPPESEEVLPDLRVFARECERGQRAGTQLSMVVELDGRVVGLVSVSGVQRGAMSVATLGYWVSSEVAGHGVCSFAVAVVIDLLLGELGLHRVEVNVRPANAPSMGLCRKLGLREEGLRRRFMCIAGRWEDHVAWATDVESMPPGGLVAHLWGEGIL